MEKQTELAEDGWTLFGTSGTVEQKLVSHYAKMEKAQASEIFGYAIATDFQKIDELHRRAELDAKSRYLKERHSFIVSRIATELGLAGSGMEEVEDFYTNNRLNADGVVRNELKESYSLLRKTADGQTEILVFYIVSPQEAVNANVEAFRKAKKSKTPSVK